MVNFGRILPEIFGGEEGELGRRVSGVVGKWRRENVGRKEKGKREKVPCPFILVSQSWSSKGGQFFQNVDNIVIDFPFLFWAGLVALV